MTTRYLFGAGLSMALFVACADPQQAASDAHDKQFTSDRKQEENAAGQRSDARVQAAEMNRADTNAAATTATPSDKTVVAADAKATEARDKYRAKATERLDKLDARTTELKQRVAKAGSKAPTSSHDALTEVATQRTMVARQLDQIPSVTADQFGTAKDQLDSQLDILEGLVKKAASEADKAK